MTVEFTHELIKGLKLVAQMLQMDGDRYFTEIHTVLYNTAKCVQNIHSVRFISYTEESGLCFRCSTYEFY